MGITLAEEEPFVHAVGEEFAHKACAKCLKSTSSNKDLVLLLCKRCKFARYCSKQCQESDWPDHRAECAYLEVPPGVSESSLQNRIIPSWWHRLVARIVNKVQRVGDSAVAFNGRRFSSLKSHSVEIENDDRQKVAYYLAVPIIRDLIFRSDLYPDEELFKVYCKTVINAFVITDDQRYPVSVGLFLGMSALDHSCDPDAIAIFNGAKAVLRSLKDGISSFSNDLRVPYCELLDVRAKRRKELNFHYHFNCDCKVCEDPEEDRRKCSLRCTHCTDGYCPFDPEQDCSRLKCAICNEMCDVDIVKARTFLGLFAERGFDDRPLDTLLDWFRRCEECLSSCNVALCNLATDVMICAQRNENYYLAAQFAKKTLVCYKVYYPRGHPSISVRAYDYAYFLTRQKDPLCISAWDEAIELIMESHGPENNFTQLIVNLRALSKRESDGASVTE